MRYTFTETSKFIFEFNRSCCAIIDQQGDNFLAGDCDIVNGTGRYRGWFAREEFGAEDEGPKYWVSDQRMTIAVFRNHCFPPADPDNIQRIP